MYIENGLIYGLAPQPLPETMVFLGTTYYLHVVDGKTGRYAYRTTPPEVAIFIEGVYNPDEWRERNEELMRSIPDTSVGGEGPDPLPDWL